MHYRNITQLKQVQVAIIYPPSTSLTSIKYAKTWKFLLLIIMPEMSFMSNMLQRWCKIEEITTIFISGKCICIYKNWTFMIFDIVFLSPVTFSLLCHVLFTLIKLKYTFSLLDVQYMDVQYNINSGIYWMFDLLIFTISNASQRKIFVGSTYYIKIFCCFNISICINIIET